MSQNTNSELPVMSIPCTAWQKPWRYLAGDTSPIRFLDFSGEELKWFSGTVASPDLTEQYTTADKQPLWWRDGEIGGEMTTDPSEAGGSFAPVLVYVYDVLQKASFSFEEFTRDWGTTHMPVIDLGAGDPDGHTKGRIFKSPTGLRLEYEHTSGEKYWLEIGEDGITSYPEISGAHVLLDHLPTQAEIDEIKDDTVVHVYDTNNQFVPEG